MSQQGQVKEQKEGPGCPSINWGWPVLRGMFFPPSTLCHLPPLPHPVQTCFLQQLEKKIGGEWHTKEKREKLQQVLGHQGDRNEGHLKISKPTSHGECQAG